MRKSTIAWVKLKRSYGNMWQKLREFEGIEWVLKCRTVWRGLWNMAIYLLEDEEENGYGLKGEIDELQKYKKKKHK